VTVRRADDTRSGAKDTLIVCFSSDLQSSAGNEAVLILRDGKMGK